MGSRPSCGGGRGAPQQLSHPSAVANATCVLVAVAVEQPAFDPDQVSRFLLTAEQTGLQVPLVLTKCDLLEAEELDQLRRRVQGWGYEPCWCPPSRAWAWRPCGFIWPRHRFPCCGPSGVGKSSLLNGLLPGLTLRVGACPAGCSAVVTPPDTWSCMRLPGARVADTPGFNRPELPDDVRNLEVLFPELRAQLEQHPCRFRDCLHRDEPGCGVTRDWERYPMYRRAVEELLGLSRPSRGG